MRLVHLELKGFGAFRDHVELDFADAEFFALVGPTGSGKSTVVDAICFALYGSVPRYDNKNLIKYVVTLGAIEARVCVTFELGGVRYAATRVVRRTPRGAVNTKEARLEIVGGAALASGEREVTEACEQLLGLRFEDFTRCVALPQGEFAEFLRAKGDARRDLMLRLLNLGVYDRIGARARALAAEGKAQVGVRTQQLEKLAFATADALDAATELAARRAALRDGVAAERSVLDDLSAGAVAARARAGEARHAAQLLTAVSVPDTVRVLAAEQREAAEAARAAEEDVADRAAARQAAEEARVAGTDLLALRAVADAYRALDGCAAAIEGAADEVAARRAESEQSAAVLAGADSSVDDAVVGQQAVHLAHLAESLAAHLAPGEPCPVCLRIVDTVPAHAAAPALDAAERALTRARAARDKAAQAHERVHRAQMAAEAKLTELLRRRGELEATLAGQPDRGDLTARIVDVERAHAAATEARAAEDAARKLADAARAARDALVARALQAQLAFDRQRDAVGFLGPPAAQRDDLLADWEALQTWAAVEAAAQCGRAEAADAEATQLDGERARAFGALRARFASAGVDSPGADDGAAFLTAAVEASTVAARHVDEIGAAMRDADVLTAEIAGTLQEVEVADLLGQLLRADRFQEWLVAEALGLLVAEASQTLRALTAGQYSLATTDKEFEVVDHGNADEHRPARTLSGGETFQASLAMALALSDQVRSLAADGAPRLDAIFLDEGFGTLDAETLEVVATTIESLGASGRMVGVITHVRELADRVPVRFEIRKGHRSSTVERVDA